MKRSYVLAVVAAMVMSAVVPAAAGLTSDRLVEETDLLPQLALSMLDNNGVVAATGENDGTGGVTGRFWRPENPQAAEEVYSSISLNRKYLYLGAYGVQNWDPGLGQFTTWIKVANGPGGSCNGYHFVNQATLNQGAFTSILYRTTSCASNDWVTLRANPTSVQGRSLATIIEMGDIGNPTTAFDLFYTVASDADPTCSNINNCDQGEDQQSVEFIIDECNGEEITMYGTDAGDAIVGTSIKNVIHTLGAPDSAVGNGGPDLICLGTGKDTGFGGSGKDTILGGPGADTIEGGSGNDTLRGEGGNDFIAGDGHKDKILGGPGNDVIDGGPGEDTINGGAGGDTIDGGSGEDDLFGGPGKDTLSGGAGRDELRGEGGDDTLRGGALKDLIFGGAGNDKLFGQDGPDVLRGGEGDDTIEGGPKDDRLLGQSDNDILRGNDGDDKLFGGSGNDVLYGHKGTDQLFSGLGLDSMDGGQHKPPGDRCIDTGADDPNPPVRCERLT